MTDTKSWHKSSYSDTGGQCVEVAEGPQTLIRDTQHRDLGHLGFPSSEWDAFLEAVRGEEL